MQRLKKRTGFNSYLTLLGLGFFFFLVQCTILGVLSCLAGFIFLIIDECTK